MTRITVRLLATASLAVAALVGPWGPAAEAGVLEGRSARPSSSDLTPAPGALSVDSPNLIRGETVDVAASGCAEDFQFVEVRLVVRMGGSRVSAVVTSADAEGATFTVPAWAPTGDASIEASCVEADLSHVSDGADILRFDYAPVQVQVGRTPRAESAPRLQARFDSSSGKLQVTGTACQGRVLVSVAKGRDRVASSDRFHFSRTLITAAPDGTWSATIPLRYTVSEFDDPAAPGPMTAFAVCEGVQYPAATFAVKRGSALPAVHVLSWNPNGVYVAQCSPLNTLTIVVTTQGASGPQRQRRRVPGHEYGESFEFFDVPADATSITYDARCSGGNGPSLKYESASVNLT